jgi:GAF domain-containing protein
MEELLKQAVELTGAWGGTIMKPQGKKRVLKCILIYNLPRDWLNITNDFDNTANGRSYLSGKPVLVQNTVIAQPKGVTTYHEIHALAAVPINKDGRVVGVVEVIKDRPNSVFSREDVSHIQDIAETIARKF